MKFYVDPVKVADTTKGIEVSFCNLWSDPGPKRPLHEFAFKLGAGRNQYCKGSLPHYRLTPLQRRRAVAAGADVVEVGPKEILRALIAWRRHFGEVVEESACCFAGMEVGGIEKGSNSTRYYICNACGKPCDPV